MEDEVEINKHTFITGSPDGKQITDNLYLERSVTINKDTFYLSENSKNLKVEELAENLQIDIKKLMLKIDLVVLLPICFLFLIANLNRTHFGFLWYNGIMSTLEISQYQFITAATVFYVPYVFFQSFSNLILRHIRPHFWISISVFCYGIVIFCTAFVQNYSGLLACEFFHGLLQSGCDSAVFYLLGHYYERMESQKRINILYSFSQLAIMISNLISYGIRIHLENSRGRESWRWFLIVEGSITFGSAFILFFILPDFPEGVRFFTADETVFIIKKLQVYSGKSGFDLTFTFKDIWKQLKDPLIIFPSLCTSFLGCIFYSYTYMETFSFNLIGYSKLDGTLRATWTYLAGFFGVIIAGFICDIIKNRAIMAIFCALSGVLGFCLIRYLNNDTSVSSGFKYFGAFCITVGSYSVFPIFSGWSFYNVSGHLRRSILTSLMIAFFDTGGIYGLWIICKDGGTISGINKTMILGLIFQIISLAIILIYVGVVFRCNKIKRTTSYKTKFDNLSEREQILYGDKVPAFDYTY